MISKDAKRLQEIKNGLQSYALAHLGERCMDFATLQEDILGQQMPDGRTPMTAERKSFLEKLASERLTNIEKIIKDLRAAGYK